MEIRADIQTRAERRAAPLGAMQAVRKALVSMPGKLLGLSIGFVLLAEILIFFPSAANYRSDWLTERTDDAYLASLAVETADEMVKADRKRDAGIQIESHNLVTGCNIYHGSCACIALAHRAALC